jgi:hypothetical protein
VTDPEDDEEDEDDDGFISHPASFDETLKEKEVRGQDWRLRLELQVRFYFVLLISCSQLLPLVITTIFLLLE